jgi:hypothetical protein
LSSADLRGGGAETRWYTNEDCTTNILSLLLIIRDYTRLY